MQAAALIDYSPPGQPGVQSIAWLLGSPSPTKPASWKRTKAWRQLEEDGDLARRVALILDTLAASLNTLPADQQVAGLDALATRPWPFSVIVCRDTPRLSDHQGYGRLMRNYLVHEREDLAGLRSRRAEIDSVLQGVAS